ncbi:MAG: tetratricopeptide repeat protein [Verrucomicrobiales bacterium]|nr:tetratricopeptide repeat protein [Verrucomicrobiales bacterium]
MITPGTISPSDPPRFPNPPVIPDYTLLRRIGAGAYGEVWLARNSATGIYRAVKMVHRAQFIDSRPFERELEGIRRFEVISRSHPSQVSLFHVGRSGPECFYYVMELADPVCPAASPGLPQRPLVQVGDPDDYTPRTLRSDLDRGRLTAQQVLDLGLALSEALAHLHDHGLVHRDVKPANIIFVNGRPKLADLGLIADASDSLSIVGTAGYIDPFGPGTPGADLFALGKVLYESLTGFERHRFPELPTDLRQWPDARLAFELNAIIVKVCAGNLAERYTDVASLRNDLAALASGRSVLSRRNRRRWLGGIMAYIGVLLAIQLAPVARRAFFAPSSNNIVRGVRDGYPGTTNEAALREYTLGRTATTQRTIDSLAQGRRHYEEAVRLDPEYALAMSGLAANWQLESGYGLTLGRDAFPRARALAMAASQINPRLEVAHEKLGKVAAWLDYDWSAAEASLRRAIEITPENAQLHDSYAWNLLIPLGRFREAHDEMDAARRLEPFDPMWMLRKVSIYYYERDFQTALGHFESLVRADPRDRDHRAWHARTLVVLGRYSEALQSYAVLDQQVAEQPRTQADGIAGKAITLARSGDSNAARALLDELLARSQESTTALALAEVYAALGDRDRAITWLETAYDHRDPDMILIRVNPRLDTLRSEPRFRTLLQRMRLLAP